MMIKIDMSEMETLYELINSSYANCEKIVERIRVVRLRMENDTEFMLLPQSNEVIESLDNSRSFLEGTRNILTHLRAVVVETPGRFAKNEEEMINTIKELTVRLDSIALGMIKIMNFEETEEY